MKLGTNDIGSVYLGTNAVQKVYLGTNEVWSPLPPPNYQDILDYATAQGYTLPSIGQQALQEQLLYDLYSAGIWSKLDTFAVFATDGDSDFALIDWKRLLNYTAVNSPTFTTNQGFTGTASSYIDTNYDLSNLTTKLITNQENISTGVYINNDSTLSIQYIMGCESSLEFRIRAGLEITATTRYMGSRNGMDWEGTGLMSIHRSYNASTATTKVYNNASDVTMAPTNLYSSISGQNIFLLRSTGNYSTDQVSFFYSGDSLIAEISDFVTATNNYMSSL